MALPSVLIFSGLTLSLSIAAHWFGRRYCRAVLASGAAGLLAKAVHEAFLRDFRVRPADAAFGFQCWSSRAMLFAFPVAALVGIPFYVIRRKNQSKAD